MNAIPSRRRPSRRERGVVLVISLLMLLVLTLIGVAATRSTTLEERMTANQRDAEVAFQAAEAGLRNGESVLQAASPGDFDNTNGLYDDTATITYDTANWDDTDTRSYEGTLDPAPDSPPRFFIVKTSQTSVAPGQSLAADAPVPSANYYYIYARGVGLSDTTYVYLESVYRR